MTAETHSNTDQSELTPDEQRVRLAALAALKRRVALAEGELKDALHATMRDGESHTVWNPADDDTQLATVNRSKKKHTAAVTDRAELTDWIAAHYPEKVVERVAATAEGIEYLQALGDPDLVTVGAVVPEWAVEEIVKASAAAREPAAPDGTLDVPGVTVTRPEGTTSVRLADDAAEQVAALIAAGRIDTDGHTRRIEP